VKLEKKNRLISIVSIIVTVVCLVVIFLLLANYLRVKAENDELRSSLENTSYETGEVINSAENENNIFYYD